jgi:hypothetical protein
MALIGLFITACSVGVITGPEWGCLTGGLGLIAFGVFNAVEDYFARKNGIPRDDG